LYDLDVATLNSGLLVGYNETHSVFYGDLPYLYVILLWFMAVTAEGAALVGADLRSCGKRVCG